jgi:hypothetical protein
LLRVNLYSSTSDYFPRVFALIPDTLVLVLDTFALIPDTLVLVLDTFALIPDTFVLVLDTFALIPDTFVLVLDTFALVPETFVLVQDTFALVPETFVLRLKTFALLLLTLTRLPFYPLFSLSPNGDILYSLPSITYQLISILGVNRIGMFDTINQKDR